MSYDIYTDKIEVRSSKVNNKPRYIVNGTGMISNKKHIYEYTKNADGSYKTLKSMFTPHCIESIKRQSKNKNLFIDSQHELALNANIKSMLKDKLSPEEQKRIDVMLKTKMLPLAKLNDIEINDDRMEIFTELNPMFREVDSDHKNYFDATWYSLEKKYLNGISANFGNFKYEKDENGDLVIDDVDVLGFSYVGVPAEHDNTINEVAIRAIQEGINMRSSGKMEDEKDKLEAEKAKLEEEKKSIAAEKAELEKRKAEDAEAVKKAELDKQAAEHKKLQEELEAKNDELKKVQEDKKKIEDEFNSAKGVVKQQAPPTAAGTGSNQPNAEFFKEKIKEIVSKHDETTDIYKKGQQPMIDNTMSGFGKMINLAAQTKNNTADMPLDQATVVNGNRYLDRVKSDIVAPNKRK